MSSIYTQATEWKSIAEQAQENARNLRAIRGFTRALQKGLNDAQYNHLFAVLEENLVTPERAAELWKKVNDFKPSFPKGLSTKETVRIGDEFFSQFTDAEVRYMELVISDPLKGTELVPAEALAPLKDTNEFVQRVGSIAKQLQDEGHKEAAAAVALHRTVQHVAKPDSQRRLKLAELLGRSELSVEQTAKLAEPFIDQELDDSLLLNVANSHPIAERLWGDRMAWLADDDQLEYTKHYEEGDSTGSFKKPEEFHGKPAERVKRVIDAPYMDAPIMTTYPFSSAATEIFHAKLEVLADRFLGFDLTTDLGAAQFESFVHHYDVSPGEYTLDRMHSYPPPLHTYDELPIIKFDGWDEADVPEDFPEYLEQQKAELSAKASASTHKAAKPAHGHH